MHGKKLAETAEQVNAAEAKLNLAASELAELKIQRAFYDEQQIAAQRAKLREVFQQGRACFWLLTVAACLGLAAITYALQTMFPAWAGTNETPKWPWLKSPALPFLAFIASALLLAWDLPDGLLGSWREKLASSYFRKRAAKLGFNGQFSLARWDFKRNQLTFED